MTFMDGILAKDPFCLGISSYFEQKIPEFISRVFDYGGLSKYVEQSNSRGTRTMCGDVEMLTFAFAGRLVITFRFEEEDLTFVGEDRPYNGRNTFGVQSFYGKIARIKDILEMAMLCYDVKNTHDHKVSLG